MNKNTKIAGNCSSNLPKVTLLQYKGLMGKAGVAKETVLENNLKLESKISFLGIST